MTPEAVTNFLTSYIGSLSEETRSEKRGPRYGFDRIIHELALARNWIPHRLSFYREGEDKLSSPKKEPEHGVDLSFLSRDGKTLRVFILKDERLTYRNWIEERFEYDLSHARHPRLDQEEISKVTKVILILAYNKDENEEGVEAFQDFVVSSGTTLRDTVKLSFERWNLTRITEEVRKRLLTPSALPESFFRRFTYLCWQVGDFAHGSNQWREILIPDWREFLAEVLRPPVNERNCRLVTVALIILRHHGRRLDDGSPDPGFETGWIDLVEWAVLAVWDAARNVEQKKVQQVTLEIWSNFYWAELFQFYEKNADFLGVEHGVHHQAEGTLSEAADSYLCFWHLGRLGILAMHAAELQQIASGSQRRQCVEQMYQIGAWIVQFINANPACNRPLLDINHIEIYLVFRALFVLGRFDDGLEYISEIFHRLLFRRLGTTGCRVIDWRNSWDMLFEYLATDETPDEGFGKSSYLLLMLLELCLVAPESKGEGLLGVIHKQLILGQNSDGTPLDLKDSVELMGWAPPQDWDDRILREQVRDGTTLNVDFTDDSSKPSIARRLEDFIKNSEKLYPSKPFSGLWSVRILACIKHASPLPSYFWRSFKGYCSHGNTSSAPKRKKTKSKKRK